MIVLTARCGACTVFYPTLVVGPDFRVRVEDKGHPVNGLRVVIDGYKPTNKAFSETDKHGFAVFRGMRPGSYHLRANLDAGISDGADLEVKLNGPSSVIVPLKWPSVEPIFSSSLKGTIHGPDYLPGSLQPRLSFDVLEAKSGRTLKKLETTDSGEFNFEGAAPGLYFLKLKASGLRGWSGEPITGLIAVVIEHGARTDHLDIDLGWSSCGLWYGDRGKCPRSDLRIEQLSGQVVDVNGAVIPDATILLFDSAQTLIDRLRSDSVGRFSSPRSLAGTYELVVKSAGFTPLRSAVNAKPTGDSTRVAPLKVQLGVFGSCSIVTPE